MAALDKVAFQKLGQILNLVRALYAKISALVDGLLVGGNYQQVDFIVDMFDRAPAAGLGRYWTNPSAFNIVASGKLAPVEGSVVTGDYLNMWDATYSVYNILLEPVNLPYHARLYWGGNLGWGDNQPSVASRYKAALSSSSYTIEVGYYVHAGFARGSYTLYVANRLFLPLNDTTFLGGTFSTHAGRLALASLTDKHALSEAWPPFAGEDWYSDLGPASAIGENKVTLEVTPSLITMSINGTAWASFIPQFVTTGAVGLLTDFAAALVADAHGEASPYITHVKAWVDGVPTPRDESGHGSYDGRFTYTDGYHNSDGDYNPLALD